MTLRTRGATVRPIDIGWRDRFLALITDPNVAYVLLMLGMLGLFFELANPGVILPGVIGGISLILAFFAFQSLPINWAGLLLILFGIVLLIAEIKVVSHGVLTIGGIIAILLGSVMLVNTAELPLRVSWTVIVPVVALTAGIFVFAVSAGVRAQMQRPTTGVAGLLQRGRRGEDRARPGGPGVRPRRAVDGGGERPRHRGGRARPRRRRRGAQASGGARVRPAGLTPVQGGRMETAFYVVPALILALFVLSSSVKILREYERAVVFRLGRLVPNKGQRPGVILLIPFVDKMVKVSLRTVAMDVAPQDVISRDNVSIKVNAVIFFRVIDPRQAVVQVEDYLYATSQIAQTTLRSVLGQVELDDLLASRDQVNQQLQRIIDQHTDPWGVKVTAVEVKHVDLPQDMQRAMSKQAEAERERRAKVINAEGEFQAAEKLAQAALVLAADPHRGPAPVPPDDARGRLGAEHDDVLPDADRSLRAVPEGPRGSGRVEALTVPPAAPDGGGVASRRRPAVAVRRRRLGVGDRSRRAPPVRDPADHRQAAPAVVRRVGGGVDHVPRVLPGGAPRGLPLRPLRSTGGSRRAEQSVVHVGALLAQPARADAAPRAPAGPRGSTAIPTLGVLSLLALTIGLPYVLLASTGPLLQAWLVRRPGVGAALPALRAVESRVAGRAARLPGPRRAVRVLAPAGDRVGARLPRASRSSRPPPRCARPGRFRRAGPSRAGRGDRRPEPGRADPLDRAGRRARRCSCWR